MHDDDLEKAMIAEMLGPAIAAKRLFLLKHGTLLVLNPLRDRAGTSSHIFAGRIRRAAALLVVAIARYDSSSPLQGAPALASADRSAGGQRAARNPCSTLAAHPDTTAKMHELVPARSLILQRAQPASPLLGNPSRGHGLGTRDS